jgi:hypothetical protein
MLSEMVEDKENVIHWYLYDLVVDQRLPKRINTAECVGSDERLLRWHP